jgi:hypothetical protein
LTIRSIDENPAMGLEVSSHGRKNDRSRDDTIDGRSFFLSCGDDLDGLLHRGGTAIGLL